MPGIDAANPMQPGKNKQLVPYAFGHHQLMDDNTLQIELRSTQHWHTVLLQKGTKPMHVRVKHQCMMPNVRVGPKQCALASADKGKEEEVSLLSFKRSMANLMKSFFKPLR